MYDMYPEWGPAQHRSDAFSGTTRNDISDTRSREAVQIALDRRDNGGERPDDS
jgi:hypothetical protein